MKYIITKKVYEIPVYLFLLHVDKVDGVTQTWTPRRREAMTMNLTDAQLINSLLNELDSEVIPYKIPSPVKQPADAT